MARPAKHFAVLVALFTTGLIVGCAASVGTTSGGGAFVSFTVGGETYTFTFGPAGIIQTRANQKVSQAGQITLFDTPPADRPATGQMTLLSSNVSVTLLPTAKGIAHQQTDLLNGSAVVEFLVAPGTSTDPCSDGVFLARYDLTVVNSAVTVVDQNADVSWEALQILFENDITMCIEVTADFDAQLTMSYFSLTFGEEEHDGDTGGTIQLPIDSSGNALTATTTVLGVGFAPVGVISVASPGSPQVVGPGSVSVDLAELGLEYVQTVYLATQTVYAFDLPAVQVATFICEYADGGTPTTLNLVLGTNTAEHAWEDADAAGYFGSPPPHAMPPVAYTTTAVNNSGNSYPQHAYYAEVSLDTSRTLSRMSLELVDINTIIPLHSGLSDHPDWLAQINLAMTLEGPTAAAEPDTGDGDDVTEEKLPAQVILTATVLDDGGNPVSGQTVDMVAEKWTADGPVADRRFEMSCSTDANGQCSRQMGFNLGGPTGEFVRFSASVTVDEVTYSEYADFHIDPTGSPDQEQWLTESVTIQVGGGADGDGAGAYTAADLAGCWRVTVNEEKDGELETQLLIFDIDSDGNLAGLWIEYEAEEDGAPVTKTLEFARFTSANAGLLGAIISNTQQEVSVNAAGTHVDISFSFDMTVDEEQPATHVALDIDDALLSGDPPSSFTSDSVSGQTLEGTFAPPADGQRADCPDASEDDVVTQEEFEADFDIDLCGSGTALMMPLMLLGLCWLKIRR